MAAGQGFEQAPPWHFLGQNSLPSKMSGKVFESHEVVSQTISCPSSYKVKIPWRGFYTKSWPTGTKLELY